MTTTAAALREAGRTPSLPFTVALADGRPLTMRRVLRLLPGKRIVGEAEFEGHPVLAKLFIANGSSRHMRREHEGLVALAAAGLPTPALIHAGPLAGDGHALLTDYLADAESLADRWALHAHLPPGDVEALAVLAPAFAMLGRLHACGLLQHDLHLGNFLHHHGRLHVIDGDAVDADRAGRPLCAAEAAANLALLIAQLPTGWDGQLPALVAAYRSGYPSLDPDPSLLAVEIAGLRAARLKDYLGKALRDCTLFRVAKNFRRFAAVVRAEADALAPLVADPDRRLAEGILLKDGGTCTVARVDLGGRALVVKRYNLKHARHALSRAWRPSRAWHSWLEGHRLRFLGIPTPAPLALVEARVGPLRGRAWLITEHCPGPNLLQHLAPHVAAGPPPAEAAALRALFGALHRQRISHGDMKATNLLWQDGAIVVIDLDAAVQHHSVQAHARAWRRDRARLLRNWPADSGLHRWLDDNLPPV
ncbi:lipopolysaccharide kinase InaA family protein [Aromatoleum sp.]|uniref:lipopolysaccharide kinase InaA family protein n=1 Tax=Aromatoleum sp. TaxID=2307007 RepID=UPI002FC69D99